MQLPLSILTYQRVLARPDPLFPECLDARHFEQHLRLLTRWFQVLPLPLALRQLRARTLPGPVVCLTFDNGYADTADVTLPLLQRYGASATYFVASRFLDGGCVWRDVVVDTIRQAPPGRLNLGRYGFGVYDVACPVRRRAVIDMLIETLGRLPAAERNARVTAMARAPGTRMLCRDQLLALHRAGMDIGAHTPGHTVLAAMSNAEARADIAECRATLEDVIQAPVALFAYPSGRPGRDFEQRHANMLRSQGFDAAVTSAWGAARPATDLYELPRFTPWDRGGSRFMLRLAANLVGRPA
jgi:peptidoglycan/xylan/chitin deacetylase (PgdA/CDA1 family)